MLEEIFNRFLTLTTLFLPMFLFAVGTKRREPFKWHVLLALFILLVFSVLAGIAFYYIYLDENLTQNLIWIETAYYLFLFVGLTALLAIPFRLNLWELLFCSSGGYCLQHIGARLGTMLELAFHYSPMTEPIIPTLAVSLITFSLNIALTLLAYFFFIRRVIDSGNIDKIANPRQVLITTIVTFVMVGYNSFGLSTASIPYFTNLDNKLFYDLYIQGTIFVCVTSILIGLLCLVVEFSWYIGGRLIHQKETLSDMLEEQKKAFDLEQGTTKTLDVALHDLRHLIQDFGEDIAPERRERILKTINTYDSIVRTGNKAIDVILTKKSLYCAEKGIRLTCCLDGKSFDFMEPYELYALFENAIDNAIEAVLPLPVEKRNISLTEKHQGMFISLRIENYCNRKILFENGLPKTDKKEGHHGYGMMSMDMIARKYGGKIEAEQEGEVFLLDIFLIAQVRKEIEN